MNRRATAIVILVLALGTLALAEETNKETATAVPAPKPEDAQIEKIRKQITDLRARKDAYILDIESSPAVVSPAVVVSGKAWAMLITAPDGSLAVETDYPTKQPPAQALPAAGIAVPTTWKLENFDPHTHLSFTIPSSEIDDKQVATFVQEVFTKLCKTKPGDKMQFQVNKQ